MRHITGTAIMDGMIYVLFDDGSIMEGLTVLD